MSARRRFAVCVVRPPGYAHSQAFDEVADALVEALQSLGHEAWPSRRATWPGAQAIVLGWQLLDRTTLELPPGSILYNLEQVQADSKWFGPAQRERLGRYPVWDYSRRNIDALQAMGIRCGAHLPIGYSPCLTRIAAVKERDIDVLFYGSLNERRHAVLVALQRAGLRVHSAFGVYGAARDALIARARIVLNLHFFAAQVFEEVRISYLLANRAFVVSESGDSDAEARYRDGLVLTGIEGIVDACRNYLSDEPARERIAARGFECMRAAPLAPALSLALATLPA